MKEFLDKGKNKMLSLEDKIKDKEDKQKENELKIENFE
jgi:hypothetical protein